MSEASGKGESQHARVEHYAIRVKGHLDPRWSEWFEGLTVTLVEGGETILSGPIVDQAALHGVLNKIRDLGLPLLSVTRLSYGEIKRHPLAETVLRFSCTES